ncbi:MAG: hypothetical protein CBB72_011720 [Muricauda sp. TMED12]|nr:MAG: hypothetical protein CBB72_011720 [Muricauda sp. TMED12]
MEHSQATTNVNIGIETYVGVNPRGVQVDLFIGENDESISHHFDWSTVINSELNYRSIALSNLLPKVDEVADEASIIELYNIALGMKTAADMIIHKMCHDYQEFDRAAWIRDGRPQDRTPYCNEIKFEGWS